MKRKEIPLQERRKKEGPKNKGGAWGAENIKPNETNSIVLYNVCKSTVNV